jgi:osmoprotectant transport system substrate-binding protein
MPALNNYRLELGAPLRSMKEEDLFEAFDEEVKTVNMVVAPLSDSHLTLPAWKVLADDRRAFAPAEAAILVRDDVLAAEPNLQAALMELSGRISLETMRKLNARVVLEEQPVSKVAMEFLASAGLK